ncbi:hypothetical protein Q5N48_18705 [Vibrio cholerae]|nr:hypothetical protein [Vibrio cholerae]MDV2358628.1 hypothetical protein [Vibrio cholerae]MDV2394655.1 hypothetical protein [Vibrio cholerae]
MNTLSLVWILQWST